MFKYCHLYLVLILLLLQGSMTIAQEIPNNTTGMSSGEDIEIKLVTIGPGDDLTSWWGHTAVIVENRRLNVSQFYNYGLFSFESDNFFMNFMMGRLIFWVGAWNTSNALAYYVSLNREIRIQVLNLSPEKRILVSSYLANNILPSNREYLYDHYRDNCSTRVRDLIDHVLDGQFYHKMQSPSNMTFREHTRRHTHRNFIVDWLLMFLMNNSIDQSIRQWDDMFLPEELERYVAAFSYTDEDKNIHSLVQKTYTYYNAKNRKPLPQGVPVHWPRGLIIGILSGLFAILFSIGYRRGIKYSQQIFGIYHVIIGFVYGIPGLILFFMSFFTDHHVTFKNENLFLTNPLTILLIPLGIGLFLGKSISLKWLPKLWYILGGLNILLIILKIFPFFNQFNWLSISLIAPLFIAMSISWHILKMSAFDAKK